MPAIELGRTWPRMKDETPAQLVAHLTDPNAVRDTAQPLLVLKQDKSVVPALQQTAEALRAKAEGGRRKIDLFTGS